MGERKALGRGLAALIPPKEKDVKVSSAQRSSGAAALVVPISSIRPNPSQPRRRFDEKALEELAGSIKEQGILQPLLVRPEGEEYVLIAGERRWQAAKMAGLKEVPVVIRGYSGRDAAGRDLELALIENIQRQDLNPMETARAMRRLVDEFGLTQEDVAKKLGMERSTVANTIRLLRLPATIQKMVEAGELSAGAARSILSLPPEHQVEIGRRAREEKWSVRRLEQAVKAFNKKKRSGGGSGKEKPLGIRDLEERLKRRLATKVEITPRGKGGIIKIAYYSSEDLMRIENMLSIGEEI